MSATNSVVAYTTLTSRRNAPLRLPTGRCRYESLSIAGRGVHTDEHVVGYYTAGDRMKHWARLEHFGVDSGGCSLGPHSLQYRALGQFLSQVHWLAGLSQALRGGCCRRGQRSRSRPCEYWHSKDSVIKYEAALKTDKFLLIVHGSSDAVYGARFILDGSGSAATVFMAADADS